MDLSTLQHTANRLRIDVLNAVYHVKSGHIGGSFSSAEIVSYLYFKEMNIKADDPEWEDRDRFVLSKGHAAPVLYSALAEKGFFPRGELETLRKFGSKLQGHPDMKKAPGVDMSTGSLGQGFAAAAGMAMAGKLNHKDYYVYVLAGDGEMEEGEIWETLMSAAKYKLDHLILFLDHNGIQLDGTTGQVMNTEPITDKLRAFNWHVIEIDGHDFQQIEDAVQNAKMIKEQPTAIVANTVKGKGVSFMENKAAWHGKAPNEEEYKNALRELEASV
ncbi:transketolase [Sporolactobacillus sp. CQH2019]|nr:transketolase [Sporolactobacillus sp. CQH2019]MDD9149711.1 transketolase [Sporolactobacillus sp. CQH2019]